MRQIVTLVLATGIVPFPVGGASPTDADMLVPFAHPKGYVCYRTTTPIRVDGDLTEKEWSMATWTDAFVDIEGDKRPKPRFKTRVKMLWDDEALYIAAEIEEPHVWATLTAHDAVIFHDNDFEVFLDPDGDNHLYGELELNALNTTWDLLLTKPYKDGGRAVNAWEISGLKTAVKINGTINDPRDTDTGWTVEIRWPWKGLKELTGTPTPPRDRDQWRINFSRVEWDVEIADGKYRKVKNKPEHNWVWSPQGVIDMHRPERWGYLQFSTARPGAAECRLDPDWPVRDLLHRAYYAERVYHKKNGRYATAVEDLGLDREDAKKLRLEAIRWGFVISADVTPMTGAKQRRLTISQDARIVKQ
jgi:cellulose/xylan binding protein with CBM9 domain